MFYKERLSLFKLMNFIYKLVRRYSCIKVPLKVPQDVTVSTSSVIMIRYYFIALNLIFIQDLFCQEYKYTIDLININNDRILVELNPPKIDQKKIEFFFPSTIPGTYSKQDYGRFIYDFKAFDNEGNLLKSQKKRT
jgi:hypothetical protein